MTYALIPQPTTKAGSAVTKIAYRDGVLASNKPLLEGAVTSSSVSRIDEPKGIAANADPSTENPQGRFGTAR